jgi:hypothetical protein
LLRICYGQHLSASPIGQTVLSLPLRPFTGTETAVIAKEQAHRQGKWLDACILQNRSPEPANLCSMGCVAETGCIQAFHAAHCSLCMGNME